jgi:hypothetical protein
MVLTSLVGVIIALAVLAVVYILLKWILSYMTLPAPLVTVLNIIVGVVAVVIVLRFLFTIIQ